MSDHTPQMVPPEPLPLAERIVLIDVVRGFALLGILIMNVPGFTTSFFAETDGTLLWNDPVNHTAEMVRDMLFSGKFNSMFSLLFGLGFTIQLGRMEARDPTRATRLYCRRLFVLLGVGAIHAFVFWPGDILHVYALLGFGLLLLRRASPRTIVVLIGICLFYPALSGTLRMLLMTPDVVDRMVVRYQQWTASNDAIYGHGTFVQAAAEHARDMQRLYTDPLGLISTAGWYVLVAMTMLLGLLIGRMGWLNRIPQLLPTIRRLQWWSLAVGTSCALLFGILADLNRGLSPSLTRIVIAFAYVLCRVTLMAFYVLTIVRLTQSEVWLRRFRPIAATGRMPLTNYLLQTAIGTTIFYGWGFGLWGKVGPALQLLVAVGVFFLIQVPVSVWWLRRFDFGPLEYLWRTLTYGRRPSDRMAPATTPLGAP